MARAGVASTSVPAVVSIFTSGGSFNSDDGGSSEGSDSGALGYDLSGHAAYRLAGLELALSGVAGGSQRSYVALTLGLDVGWLGL